MNVYNLVIDIPNSIMDIHNWIVDFPKWIMDIHDWIYNFNIQSNGNFNDAI